MAENCFRSLCEPECYFRSDDDHFSNRIDLVFKCLDLGEIPPGRGAVTLESRRCHFSARGLDVPLRLHPDVGLAFYEGAEVLFKPFIAEFNSFE